MSPDESPKKNQQRKKPKPTLPGEDEKLSLSVSSREPISSPNEGGSTITSHKRRYNFGSTLILLLVVAFSLWGSYRTYQMSGAATPTTAPTFLPALTSEPTLAPTEEIPIAVPTYTPIQLTETPAAPAMPAVGGSDMIALIANREIWLMNVDGSNLRQVTIDGGEKTDLQWLPGGRQLLYGEGNCIYTIDLEDSNFIPERIGCYAGENFDGFRVSPDGDYVAISIERRLIVLPFDLEFLSTAKTAFELQSWDNTCIDYADVAVKSAQWSADSRKLAIKYQGFVNQIFGDIIQIIAVDLRRCSAVAPLLIDEFPRKDYVPEGYERNPVISSFSWDGNQYILFNTFIRNGGYGELYLYNLSISDGTLLNPVNGSCCYRSATFSPDGTYILFMYQDVAGSDNEAKQYYVPLDRNNVVPSIIPFRLPLSFFSNPRENILFAPRPLNP